MNNKRLSERYKFDYRRIQFEDSYHIEYCITDVCNRNCAACSHLAPLAKRENFVGIEEFIKNSAIIRNLIPDIHTFWITGGEPTLHPDFLLLLKIARDIFPNCFVGIYSNGYFLKKYENDLNFWNFIRDNGIVWAITTYDLSKEFIENVFTEHGCLNNLAIVHSGKRFSNLTNYSRNQPITADKFKKCGWERSKINIRNGKIFNCPSAEFVDLFNDYFNCDLELNRRDYLIINERLTKKQFEEFRGATPFCGNCDLSQRYKKIFKNTKSNRLISEWSTF